MDIHGLGEAVVSTVMKFQHLKDPMICLETVRYAAFQRDSVPQNPN